MIVVDYCVVCLLYIGVWGGLIGNGLVDFVLMLYLGDMVLLRVVFFYGNVDDVVLIY